MKVYNEVHAGVRTEPTRYDPHARVTKTGQAVFVTDKAVVLQRSNMIQGIRHDNGKRWCRWENSEAFILYRNHKGNLVGLTTMKGSPSPEVARRSDVWNVLSVARSDDSYKIYHVFRAYTREQFGVTSFLDVYPMATHYGLEYFDQIPKGLTSHFRQADPGMFVRSLFGKTRYRKDLVKAVMSARVDELWRAYQFRGLVPIDWIIEMLRTAHRDVNTLPFLGFNHPALRAMLKELDPRSYRHLVQTPILQRERYLVYDVLDFYTLRRRGVGFEQDIPLRGARVRTWDELHAAMFPTGRGRGADPSPPEPKEISLIPVAQKLNEVTAGDMIIKPATNTTQMWDWSEQMSNCIQGYAYHAVQGTGVYAGVYRGEKLVANLEITKGGALKQLLGKHNRCLEADDRKTIEGTLVNNGITVPTEYWGSGER